MKLSQVREELISHHDSLRALVASTREAFEGLPAGFWSAQIAPLLRTLAHALSAHNAREEELLGDVLPNLDAWGDVRAELMNEHHRVEHNRLRDALRAAAEVPDAVPSADVVLPLLEELLAHMRQEEKDVLNAKVLHDDGVVVDQSDG